MMFDVAVIGGSFAGLSAALQLARARQRVAVIDAGARRNRFADTSHGFLAQDGRPPAAIVQDARDQLARYPSVQWMDATVSDVGGAADAFEVHAGGKAWAARRIILGIGVVDRLPPIPGLQERWGRSVFHCPYCHGYELHQGRIGVIAAGPASLHQAMLLPEWGSVTFFLNGALVLDEVEQGRLAARGVAVEAAPVRAIAGKATVLLADGRSAEFDGLFTASRTEPASALAEQLGCEHEASPLGRYVRTDAMKETTVPGVFACGDVARAAGNVALAVGDGALAGAAAHRSLVFGL
jgi:thioredoxin reductase